MNNDIDIKQIQEAIGNIDILDLACDKTKLNEYFNNHLREIDPIELSKRIRHFRSNNVSCLCDEDLLKEIMRVLCWNDCFLYIPNIKECPKGTSFFRVRKLESSIVPIPNFCRMSDFWEPPSSIVKNYGRLNKPGEALLYTSIDDPIIAVKEARVEKDDWYAIIQYKSNSPTKVNMIGGEYDYEKGGISDKRAILAHEMYNDFLQTEFSRDVGIGTEYLYRISELIAKSFFDLPPEEAQDAWGYSSVQDKKKYNVCFRPEIAHKKLDLNGAMICKKEENDVIKVYCIAVPVNYPAKEVEYYPLGSIVQKCLFPEIVCEASHDQL